MLYPLKKHNYLINKPKLNRKYPLFIKVKDSTLAFEKKKVEYSIIHSLNKQTGFGLFAGKKLIKKLGLDLQTPIKSLPPKKF
jgi:hypothetical protein